MLDINIFKIKKIRITGMFYVSSFNICILSKCGSVLLVNICSQRDAIYLIDISKLVRFIVSILKIGIN
jgi:hypothetical protein